MLNLTQVTWAPHKDSEISVDIQMFDLWYQTVEMLKLCLRATDAFLERRVAKTMTFKTVICLPGGCLSDIK